MAQINDVAWSPDTGFSVTQRSLQSNAPANHDQRRCSDQRGPETGMEQRRKRSYPTPVQGDNSKIITIYTTEPKRRYVPTPDPVRSEHSDASLMARRRFVGPNTMSQQSTKILQTVDRSNSAIKNIDRGVPGSNTLQYIANKNRKEIPEGFNLSKQGYVPTPRPNSVQIRSDSNTVKLATERGSGPLMAGRRSGSSATMSALPTANLSDRTSKNIVKSMADNNPRVPNNWKETPRYENEQHIPRPVKVAAMHTKKTPLSECLKANNYSKSLGAVLEMKKTLKTNVNPLAGYGIPKICENATNNVEAGTDATVNRQQNVPSNPNEPNPVEETSENIANINNARPVKVAAMHTKKTPLSECLKANNYSKSLGAVLEMKKTLKTNANPLAGYGIPKIGENATNNVKAGTDATVNRQQNVPSNPNEPNPVEETSENIANINNANTSAEEANQTDRDTTQLNSQIQHKEHLKNESSRRADGTTKAELYKCPLCPLHFSNETTAKRHRDADDHWTKGLECNDCGYQFSGLDRHRRKYHTEKSNLGPNDFIVTILPKLVYNNKHMQKMAHNVEHRPDNGKKLQIQEIKTFFMVYQCSDCTLCHTDIEGVKRHMSSEECLDIITYECTICHWRFDEASHLLHRQQHSELQSTGYHGNQGFELTSVHKRRIFKEDKTSAKSVKCSGNNSNEGENKEDSTDSYAQKDKGSVDGCKTDTNKTMSAETDASQSLKDQRLLACIDLLTKSILNQNRQRDIEVREAETERAKNRQREKASKTINKNKTIQYNIVMQTKIKNKHVKHKYKNVAKERESRR